MKYSALPALLLFSAVACAEDGTVLFTGGIHEVGCHYSVTGQALRSSCYRNGEWRQQSQPLAEMVQEKQRSAPFEERHLTWLDSQHKVGVVTISVP